MDSVTASAPGDIDALLAEAAEEYQHVESLRWDIDARTPPEFEARLQFEGYESREDLLFILEGDLRGQSPEAGVRLVDDEHGWAAFGSLHAIDWARDNGADGAPDPDDAAANFESLRSKSPPAQFWLAFVDDTPAGYVWSWAGNAGVGLVETLFVASGHRHRGLATALLHRGVADCRERGGAGPIAIGAVPSDTPKNMYAALGWRPIAVRREYRRRMSTETVMPASPAEVSTR